MFGDDLLYMGIFLMTGIFYVANMIFIALVAFPDTEPKRTDRDAVAFEHKAVLSFQGLGRMLSSRGFLIPMLVASVAWAAMGMPMSLVRVVMGQLGLSATQSLRVIELHFLGMYFPGFFTGSLIKRFGYKQICYLSVLLFAVEKSKTDVV